MLANKKFADLEEKKLKKVNLMFNIREKLIIINSIKFNDEVISQIDEDILILNQSKQFDHLRLIIIKSTDLIESRSQIRKSVTSKDQYVTQRIRDA
jgi:dihydroorotate dehydrogenase